MRKILSSVGITAPELEVEVELEQPKGGAAAAPAAAAGEAPKRRRGRAPAAPKETKPETIQLLNGTSVQGEIQSAKTKGGRTRYYITQDGKEINVSKKGRQWSERKKGFRSFEGYVPTSPDMALLRSLSEFEAKGVRPKFSDLSKSLNLKHGPLLGRYRVVSGAGFAARTGDTYGLTERGRQLLTGNGSAGASTGTAGRKGKAGGTASKAGKTASKTGGKAGGTAAKAGKTASKTGGATPKAGGAVTPKAGKTGRGGKKK